MADGAAHPTPSTEEASLLARIITTSDTCFGRPRVRGTRIRVIDVLGFVASGATIEEIIEDYPSLNADDIRAAVLYAAVALQDHKPPPNE